MPLPDNFSPWEHLQNVVMQVQNRIVREEFNDVGDDNWDPDITTARASLRVACTLRDNDSAIMTLIRLWLFYGALRKAQDFAPPIYGIPVTSFQESIEFYPQVQLYFLEDISNADENYGQTEAQISFRLMGETSQSMTETKARALANRVRTAFASANGFTFQKGRNKYSYREPEKGYQLVLTCPSEAEARRVIEQVLDIQNHSPNWECLTESRANRSFPANPGNHLIYGKQRKKPRKRPMRYVRFRYATLHLWGLPNPITLVDRTGLRRNPLIAV